MPPSTDGSSSTVPRWRRRFTARAELNLSHTTIQAPIDGLIGFLTVDQGNLVGPNRFCQISRQAGFLGWDVKPSSSRVASKNGGLCMEENTALTLLARNLTEPPSPGLSSGA